LLLVLVIIKIGIMICEDANNQLTLKALKVRLPLPSERTSTVILTESEFKISSTRLLKYLDSEL